MTCNNSKFFTFNDTIKEIVDFFLEEEKEIHYMGVTI